MFILNKRDIKAQPDTEPGGQVGDITLCVVLIPQPVLGGRPCQTTCLFGAAGQI